RQMARAIPRGRQHVEDDGVAIADAGPHLLERQLHASSYGASAVQKMLRRVTAFVCLEFSEEAAHVHDSSSSGHHPFGDVVRPVRGGAAAARHWDAGARPGDPAARQRGSSGPRRTSRVPSEPRCAGSCGEGGTVSREGGGGGVDTAGGRAAPRGRTGAPGQPTAGRRRQYDRDFHDDDHHRTPDHSPHRRAEVTVTPRAASSRRPHSRNTRITRIARVIRTELYIAAAVLSAAAMLSLPLSAEAADRSDPPSAAAVLDVPFMPESE